MKKCWRTSAILDGVAESSYISIPSRKYQICDYLPQHLAIICNTKNSKHVYEPQTMSSIPSYYDVH